MSKEKRRAKRIKEETKVIMTILSKDVLPPGKKISYHLSKDISSGGVKILTDTFLPTKTMMKIEVTLEKPLRLIRLYGKVRWVKTLYADELFEVGIKFENTDPENVKILERHIEEIEKPEE